MDERIIHYKHFFYQTCQLSRARTITTRATRAKITTTFIVRIFRWIWDNLMITVRIDFENWTIFLRASDHIYTTRWNGRQSLFSTLVANVQGQHTHTSSKEARQWKIKCKQKINCFGTHWWIDATNYAQFIANGRQYVLGSVPRTNVNCFWVNIWSRAQLQLHSNGIGIIGQISVQNVAFPLNSQ